MSTNPIDDGDPDPIGTHTRVPPADSADPERDDGTEADSPEPSSDPAYAPIGTTTRVPPRK